MDKGEIGNIMSLSKSCQNCGWRGCISCNDFICPSCGEDLTKIKSPTLKDDSYDWWDDVYVKKMSDV